MLHDAGFQQIGKLTYKRPLEKYWNEKMVRAYHCVMLIVLL